ncbi:MAG: ABC transporter ATP-binding protein [Promethearchaeota archaeon]
MSFKVKEGEIFCVIGPNGAGKSTLVKLITGQIRPTKGVIKVNNRDPFKERKHLHGFFGLVPQETALYEELTGRENLEFHARLYGMNTKILKEKIDSMLEIARLEERQNDMVSTYSGGMKRRLLLIRALLHDPKIVILDEPTLGVDVQSRKAIHDYILELPKRGKTVFLTTNYMEEAERLADRLIILDTKIIEGPGRILEIQEKVFPNSIIEFKTDIKVLNSGVFENLLKNEMPGKIISEKVLSKTHVLLQIIFETSNITELFEKFISFTRKKGINIEEFTIKRPTLEDVFIKLTGKEFRE